MPPLEKTELVKFLETNVVVFAWSTYDIPGIDPGFICHQLNVNSRIRHVGSLFGNHPTITSSVVKF